MRRSALSRATTGAAIVAAVLFAVGCGDDSGSPATDTGGTQKDSGPSGNDTGGGKQDGSAGEQLIIDDLGTTDTTEPLPECDPTVIGKVCTPGGTDCGAKARCLGYQNTDPPMGICSCDCRPANGLDPDTCWAADPSLVCGQIPLSGGTVANLCLKKCEPKLGSTDCDLPIACQPGNSRFLDSQVHGLETSLTQTVCFGIGCTADSDCPSTNGIKCDTAQADSCTAPAKCLPLFTGSTEGLCAVDGKCDTASGLCDAAPNANPTAKIGDTCKGDSDCGPHMFCRVEVDFSAAPLNRKDHGEACANNDECCGRCNQQKCEGTCIVSARNGYCSMNGCIQSATLTQHACPADAECFRIFSGGLCMKKCKLGEQTGPDSCRGNDADQYGDYECRAWQNLLGPDQTPVWSSSAICDFGGTLTCAQVNNCNVFGENGNPTDMQCRDLKTGLPTTMPTDPAGFCLDQTTSGKSPAPAPDGGVPQGG